MKKILQQGAEAVIYLEGNNVIKDRIKKSYRNNELDNHIRILRTRSEKKLLEKASKIIDSVAPCQNEEKFSIKIPFIDGKKLSDNLDNFQLNEQKKICEKIGENTAKLHENNIIHGDLTTSNMILIDDKRKKKINTKIKFGKNNDKLINKKISNINNNYQSGERKQFGLTNSYQYQDKMRDNSKQQLNNLRIFKVFFIDFGLGFISNKIEDKAVDIHLFKEALEAKHFKNWEILFNEFLKGYRKYSEHNKVLEQLKKVELRGRYRH